MNEKKATHNSEQTSRPLPQQTKSVANREQPDAVINASEPAKLAFVANDICTSHAKTLAEFTAWLETQPPTGRTVEEIEQQIREERDSWDFECPRAHGYNSNP